MASARDILKPGGLVSRRLERYEPRPGQMAMADVVEEALSSGQHAVIEGGTGVGKALDVATPIATPEGWTRMGDLRAGDMVFDETGTPTPVARAFDVMYDRPCYEVAFSDGSVLVADADHEWITHTWRDRTRAHRQRNVGPRRKNFATADTLSHLRYLLNTNSDGTTSSVSATEVVNLIGGHRWSVWRATREITPVTTRGRKCWYARTALLSAVLARLESDVAERRPGTLPFSRHTTRDIAATLTVTCGPVARLNHAVPLAHALELPDRGLPIVPYVLGVWLGDGSSNNAQVTTADPDIIREIESAGYIVRKLKSTYLYSLHLSSGLARTRWEPSLTSALRDLGVLNNKHIPLTYLRASERQRRALLAGLLDTDGTVSPHGAIQYTSTNPRLARDVQALILSLGYRPSMMRKSARLNGKDCGLAYTINFRTTDQVFLLPRKIAAHAERLRNYAPRRNKFRYVTAVRPVPSRPVRCIQVAAASHLYLAGESLIPTHNSLAYLIPAIYSGKRVIVSTANKALQDQLITKDIPFLQHALPREIRAALVKGRSNYLCLDRLDEEERFAAMGGQARGFGHLKAWAASSGTGDVEELAGMISRELLGRVVSTRRTCIGAACQYFYDACFVEKMRERAEASSLIVCNHALLLADAVVRDLGAHLLPDRDAVVVDEAHRLEDAAIDAFTVRLGRRDLTDFMESVLARRYVTEHELAALPELIGALFRPVEASLPPVFRRGGPAPSQFRGTTLKLVEPLAGGEALAEALAGIAARLAREDPYREARHTREGRNYEQLVEWSGRLAEDVRLVSRGADDDSVRYATGGARAADVTLTWSPIDVSGLLAELLFKQSPVICTSATLAVGDFTYFKRAVGIEGALELAAPSPFDYREQCLLYVPAHLPEFRGAPTPEYSGALWSEIERLVALSRGRAFVLFTSTRGMDEAHAALCDRLDYTVLKQGEASRGELLRRFRAGGAAVLFATRSFWEGVDVMGDALSLVVIDRMPFSVPDDPVIGARIERMKRDGDDWFNDLMLPAATLQLKQGFGRLIRSRDDRGVVAILDSRLAHKSYGQRVIRALPSAALATHVEEVEQFFAANR